MAPVIRSILKWLWLLFVVMVIGGALLYSLRNRLIAPHLSTWIEQQIKAETGLSVSVGRVRGTYFNQIIIENLVTRDPIPGNPLRRLDLKRVEATYSLFTLLKSTTAFIESVSVNLKQADATLDWRFPADAPQTEKNGPLVLPTAFPTPDLLPRIHLENASIDLHTEDFSGKLEDLDADLVQSHSGEKHLALTAASWQWNLSGVSRGQAPVRLDLYYTEKSIAIAPLTIGGNALTASAGIILKELPDALPFSVKLTTADAAAEISGSLRSSELEARFQADKLDLGALSSGAPDETFKADGRLSLKGGLRIPLNRPEQFDGSLVLDLHGASYRGFKAERLQADALAESGAIRIRRLDLSDPYNRIDIRELLLPFEWVSGARNRRLLEGVAGSFQLDLQDLPSLLRMVGADNEKIPSNPPAHRLRITGAVENGGIVRAQGNLSISENTLHMKPSTIEIPLPERSPDRSRLDIHLRPDFNDLGLVSRLFPIPALGGRLKGDVSIGGTLGRPRGRIELHGQGLVVEGIPVGSLTALIAGDGRRITVENVKISNGIDVIDLRGRYDVKQHIVEDAQLALKIAEVRTYLDPWKPLPVKIQGDLRVKITASGPLTMPEGKLTASSRRLQLGNTALADIRLKANSRNGELRIETAETSVLDTRMKLAGTLRPDNRFERFEAEVSAFSVQRNDLVLRMPQPAQLRLTPDGNLHIANLELTGPVGDIRLEGEWSPKGESDFRLQASRLNGKGWFSDLVAGRIDFEGLNAEAHLQGTATAPRIEFVGRIDALQSPYVPVPLTGRFDLTYAENRLNIREFDWRGEGGYRINANGSAASPCDGKRPSTAERLSLTSSVQLPEAAVFNMLVDGQPVVAGSLTADLKMEGSWVEPFIDLRINAQGIKLKPDLAAFPEGPLEIQSRIQYREKSVFIDTFTIQAPSVKISATGAWHDGPTGEILCKPPGEKLPGELSIDGTIQVSEIGWLSSRIPEIRRIEGSLDADFQLRGPIGRPAVTAAVFLKNGFLRPQMNLPPLAEIRLEASVTPSIIEIRQLHGLLGGAAFRINGTVTEPMAENPVADIQLRGENLLFYRDKGLRLRADTDLSLRGPLNQLVLSGELAVTDGLFDRYIDWLGSLQGDRAPESSGGVELFSFQSPPLKDMRFDVKIRSKAPFRIRSNIVRGRLRPELGLIGSGETPLLLGKVYVDSARLRLPAGTMAMENGIVQFLESDPDRPILELGGTSRMLGYDITMLVEGPYDDPVVTLTSSPPLSNEDILLLVLTGTPPPREGRTIDSEARNLNVAVYIGRDLIARWFSSDEESTTESVLERFELELGRDVTQKGEETLQAQFRLTQGIFQKNDTLYITGEKDVFDYYNAGLRIVFRFK